MNLLGVHHVAFVVADLDAGVQLWSEGFGFEEAGRVENDDLSAIFLASGDVLVELIALKDENAVESRLGDRRAVLDHVAFSVDGLEDVLERLEALGIELAGGIRMSRTSRTVFTDATTTDDVTLQFVEHRQGD